MTNPRRTSYSNQLPISEPIHQFQSQSPLTATTTNSYDPFGLTQILPEETPCVPFSPLRFPSPHMGFSQNPAPFCQFFTPVNEKNVGYFKDSGANIVKFSSFSSIVTKDKRGWLLNPVSLALDAAVPGAALSCVSVHVGEIRPGAMRGNHRHHTCNETFVIWGAKTVFRVENNVVSRGYSEVTIDANEVAVTASPTGKGGAKPG